MTAVRREFGEGPLARVAAWIYTMAVVEGLFLVAALPGLALLLLLDRDASNIPLAAICALPLGPATSAVLFALRHRRADLTDLRPARAFWRGYRTNFGAAGKLSALWLTGQAVVGIVLTHRADAGIPGWWAALLVLLSLFATMWGANALIVGSLFAFRLRDTARLALHFLWRTPRAAVATACLLVVAAGITLLWTEAAAVLLTSLFANALLTAAGPMITEIQERYAR